MLIQFWIRNVFKKLELIMVGFESVQFWNVENGSIDEAGVSIKMMHVRPLARIHIWKSVLDVVLLENLANVECI
jgi:hypothetical protein